MDELAQHWPDIRAAIEVIGVIVAFVVMFLVAVKWKIPMLSKAIDNLVDRVDKLEKVAHSQDVNKADLAGYVRKEEIYEPTGDLKFLSSKHCAFNQDACQRLLSKDIQALDKKICSMRDDLGKYVDRQDKYRTDLIAVQKDMVAVAQQLRDVVTADRQKELKDLAAMIVNKINGKL